MEQKSVSFEEKINILEDYYKTGKTLNGKTIYKGYPIGYWAIQTRSLIFRGKMIVSKEQYDKLERIGLLEKQIDCHLDEKIDRLIDFKNKYPDIEVNLLKTPVEQIKKYTKTEEELKNFIEEYKKIQSYYDYVKERKRQGKLTEEQFKKCKEGKIGGIFQYSEGVERIVANYNQTPKDVDYILRKFGSMKKFFDDFQKGRLEERDILLTQTMLTGEFDIDLNSQSKRYDVLFNAILGRPKVDRKLRFYSSKHIDNALEKLLPNEKKVLEYHFGLLDGKILSFGKISKELGLSRNRIYQIEKTALRRLRTALPLSTICSEKTELTTEEIKKLKKEEKERYLELKENLFIYSRFKPVGNEKIESEKKNLEYFNLIKKVKEDKEEDFLKVPVEIIGLESRTVRLLKRGGYNTVGDAYNGRSVIRNIKGFGEKAFYDIYNILLEKGINLNDKSESNLEKLKNEKEKLENKRNNFNELAVCCRKNVKVKEIKEK